MPKLWLEILLKYKHITVSVISSQ